LSSNRSSTKKKKKKENWSGDAAQAVKHLQKRKPLSSNPSSIPKEEKLGKVLQKYLLLAL
jgi:hypothetical protein